MRASRATAGALSRLLLHGAPIVSTPCQLQHAARPLTQLPKLGEADAPPSSYSLASVACAVGAALSLGFAAAGHAQAKQTDDKAKQADHKTQHDVDKAKPKEGLGQAKQAEAQAKSGATKPAGAADPSAGDSLPTYTMEDVAKHKDKASGIWVTYKGQVYDITDFVDGHPGGTQKIMLAAGSSIEPFWNVYKQHDKAEVRETLKQFLIGRLEGGGKEAEPVQIEDPFKNDPARHPALVARSSKPYNAETPGALLADNLITPTELFYVRNHLSVPEVDISTWKLKIEGQGLRTVELTMDELKTRFKKHVIASTIQCGGNRRNEMKAIKPVKGLDWDTGAIGTGTFGGVLLRDVLQYAGLSDAEEGVQHAHFVGLDRDPLTGETYHVSIPINKAMNPQGDVLLAYEMNGEPLTRDHGFPLRAVVPGVVGARNAKWLTKIITSAEESSSFWQQRDYKNFSPGIDWDNVDWNAAPAIQDMPVTSAVCEPATDTQVSASDGEITAKGYAWAGGGRSIVRVETSLDGGKTWQLATLHKLPQRPGRAWAWSLWEVTMPLPKNVQPGTKLRLLCRAVDDGYNVQPDTVAGVWNLRGMLNNAWHGVNLNIVE